MESEKAVILNYPETKRASLWRRSIMIFMTGILLYYLTFQGSWYKIATPHRAYAPLQPKPITYENEEGLVWEPCGEVEGSALECSRINVPMDQYDSASSGNKTFSLPLLRLRGNDDAKNLLINPGGPGGSGVEFVYRRGKQVSTIVGPGYHILSFDPRGVNGSIPAASCYPDVQTRRNLFYMKNDYHPEESSSETFAWTAGFVKSCAETMGEHGKYINTPQTAADMNSILDAVGQDDMIYWGFSYGTLLGQTYATLFPERSHRVMIDGVINVSCWYQDLYNMQDSFIDTDKVLFGFFDECIKAGSNCPLSYLAKSPVELQHRVLDFAFSLEEPLSVYINSSNWGTLRPENIIVNGLFRALYKPESWWTTADYIAKMMQGNATEAFLAWGGNSFLAGNNATDSFHVITINDALSGSQYWPQGRQNLLDLIIPWLNSSIFSPLLADLYYKQQQWIIPSTPVFKPKKTVKTAHPLLILNPTLDPVCPMASAKIAQSIFEGSQIIERNGYGHCTMTMPSTCVAKHVRAYLENGTVPAHQVKCKEDGSYYVKPGSDAMTSRSLHFEDPEDEAIYRAQLELAQDPNWPYMR